MFPLLQAPPPPPPKKKKKNCWTNSSYTVPGRMHLQSDWFLYYSDKYRYNKVQTHKAINIPSHIGLISHYDIWRNTDEHMAWNTFKLQTSPHEMHCCELNQNVSFINEFEQLIFYIDFHNNKYNCSIRPYLHKLQMQNCHDVSLLALTGNQTWFGHLLQSLL